MKMANAGISRVVAVHGAFVGDNFGDTLLLQLTVKYLNQLGYRALISNACQRTLSRIKGHWEPLTSFGQLKGVEALIYTGGGYFGEQPKNKVRWHAKLFTRHLPIGIACRALRKPFGCAGTGVGPLSFPISRACIGWLLGGGIVNAVRDHESKEYLTLYGCSKEKILQTVDLAMTLQKSDVKAKTGASPYVVFHLSHPSNHDKGQREVFAGAEAFLGRNPGINLIAMLDKDCPRQRSAAYELHARLGSSRSEVQEYSGPTAVCELLAGAMAVVTNKLHVGIVATALEVPAFSASNHPKTIRFFRQIGRAEFCIPRAEVTSANVLDFLAAASKGRISKVENHETLRSMAQKNIRVMEQIIEGRRKIDSIETSL